MREDINRSFKDAQMIFKFNRSQFPVRKRSGAYGRGRDDCDVKVSLSSRNGKTERIRLSFREDLISNFPTQRITSAVVRYAGKVRLYILDSEDGFLLSQPNQSTSEKKSKSSRWYACVPTNSVRDYFPFMGHHKLEYDSQNDAWYIEL